MMRTLRYGIAFMSAACAAIVSLLLRREMSKKSAPSARPESNQETQEETLRILRAELKDGLDKQFQTIDALDRKAGVVLGSASLVVALMTFASGAVFQKALEPSCASNLLRLGFVVAGLIYALIICCVVLALKVRTYYLPTKLDRDEIEGYLDLDRAGVRRQLLANYIQRFGTNLTAIAGKARWVQISLVLLAADGILLTILVIVGTSIAGP